MAGCLLLRTSPEQPSLLLGHAIAGQAIPGTAATSPAATASDAITVFASRMAGAGLLSSGGGFITNSNTQDMTCKLIVQY